MRRATAVSAIVGDYPDSSVHHTLLSARSSVPLVGDTSGVETCSLDSTLNSTNKVERNKAQVYCWFLVAISHGLEYLAHLASA